MLGETTDFGGPLFVAILKAKVNDAEEATLYWVAVHGLELSFQNMGPNSL